MLFTEPVFFVFLPLVLATTWCLRHRAQNAMLLAASYLFYGWWDWRFLCLLWASTLMDYTCARVMTAYPRYRRPCIVLSLSTSLCLLGFFKYADFFIDSAASLLVSLGFTPHFTTLGILLPVGISFYTFQTMAYTIDVYRGDVEAERSLLDFALFVAFFPQLVAGPIERAGHLLHQIKSERHLTWQDVVEACQLLLTGYFLKIAVADVVAPGVSLVRSSYGEQGWGMLLSGTWLFALQIYGDFAGYSRIAQGTARLLGVRLMDNFQQPYLSRSITEFWRRWHISLSSWLRDYLYIPLGGNRKGRVRTYVNLFTTMLLGGLWHGASWHFVAWGAAHGSYLGAHKATLERAGLPRVDRDAAWRPIDVVKVLLTFHLVCLTWVFFFMPTLASSLGYLGRLLTFQGSATLHGAALPMLALILVFDVAERRGRAFFYQGMPWPVRGVVYAGMVLACVLLGETSVPFIYFQF